MQRADRLALFGWLALLLLIGGGAVLANRDLPLVRNSLVYARASENVIEQGYDPRPVVADSKLSYDKPILYAWLSAPFVRRFGSHDGLRFTSYLGTLAFLLAVRFFARSFRGSLPDGSDKLLLWLSALGPCVVYQFWSAHPDSLFAAFVIVVWGMTHRIVTQPQVAGGRRLVVLGAALYGAILLKNYGLVLLLTCPLYLLWNLRRLRAAAAGRTFRRLLLVAIGVFGVIGALVLLAWTGHHPLSRLEGEGGGVGQYGKGELWMSFKGTWIQVGLALLLQFHVALLFALKSAAWRSGVFAPLACFAGVYVAGLLPFPTTFYNMRYFLPLFPVVALVLVRGAAAFPPRGRRFLIGAHAALGILLVLVFNSQTLHRVAEPAIPRLEVNWIGTPLSLLDNLRMPLHREQKALLDHLNREVPAGATLYMMDVVYYRDAQQGVYERAGLLRSDIVIRYVSRRGFQPAEPDFYVWDYLTRPAGRPLALEPFGRVTDLGRSLYHVETAPAGG